MSRYGKSRRVQTALSTFVLFFPFGVPACVFMLNLLRTRPTPCAIAHFGELLRKTGRSHCNPLRARNTCPTFFFPFSQRCHQKCFGKWWKAPKRNPCQVSSNFPLQESLSPHTSTHTHIHPAPSLHPLFFSLMQQGHRRSVEPCSWFLRNFVRILATIIFVVSILVNYDAFVGDDEKAGGTG